MTVYVDNAQNRLGRMIMCHMLADTVEELHDMARRLGVDRHYQKDHYDICKKNRALAIRYGAKEVTQREAVLIRRAFRKHKIEYRRALIDQRNELNGKIADLIDVGGAVVDEWIIVRRPNCVPEVKRPGIEADGTMTGMLRELIKLAPEGTKFVMVQLSWNHELWVEDGHVKIQIEDSLHEMNGECHALF